MMFDKKSEKFGTEAEILSASSNRVEEKARTAKELANYYPNLTQAQLGVILGNIYRKNKMPYKDNTVNEWLNDTYKRN